MNNEYLWEITLIFLIGAFIGWIYEVIFYYFTEKRLDNPGILYGPWLPIYGAGAVLIYFLLPLREHPLLIFISIILITGVLEYLVGYITLKYFNERLWDYRDLFLNIAGFICLRSLLTFAFGGMILIYFITPIINLIIQFKYVKYLLITLVIFFIIDLLIGRKYKQSYKYKL